MAWKSLPVLLLVSIVSIVCGAPPAIAHDYTPIKEAGWCAMVGGNCGEPNALQTVCVNNTRAIANAGIRAVCPMLGGAEACCDRSQLLTLEAQLQQATALFGRCQSCLWNFRAFWCEVVCSPNQSQFVAVTSVNPGVGNSSVVNSTTVSISPEWAEQWYESCDNVQFGATGTPVFEVVFGASDYEQVFSFIGKPVTAGGYSPFEYDFAYPEDSPLSLHDTTVIESCAVECECVDCPLACPNLTPVAGPGMCAMYGTCSASVLDQYQNCVNNSFAVPAGTYNVSSVCGGSVHFSGGDGEGAAVCCDATQFSVFSAYAKELESVFGACPACASNLIGLYCSLACSPDQSVFSDVQHATKGTKGLPVVDVVQLRLDPTYVQQLWDSCSAVTIAQTGVNAMKQWYGATSVTEFVAALALPAPVGRYAISISAPLQIENSLNTTAAPIIPCAGNCPAAQCPTQL